MGPAAGWHQPGHESRLHNTWTMANAGRVGGKRALAVTLDLLDSTLLGCPASMPREQS